ncbi:MAG: RHS repeat-associated core domain-containing protein [Alcanivorax sp.]|uniref:RHS repeat-associated core domain-containing protein n=1 Tax=Alloalcanivorax marinus TaxID=1177169 RepID=UPI00195EA653|nr:RHS repeat-associated core domain-containing protein [Alloalcanivorax marinus]MBM7335095.1 hypothetical protein [Alloalcanivorax marinus]
MRVVLYFLLVVFPALSSASYQWLSSHQYEIYQADIESVEHGLDGYEDIFLKARPAHVPIGVGITFPVPIDTGYEDILLCGSASGTFSVCTLSPQAVLPLHPTDDFDLRVGDFDADGMVDVFLHSLNANVNSIYLRNSANGRFSVEDQFTILDGVAVSGNPDVAVGGKYGGEADELIINGDYYSELEDGRFGKIGGVRPIYSLVGASESSFSVDKGAANYTIPIITPKGGAGITPSVSLDYSSNGGYGQAGMGFQISGLSSVTRCGRNKLRDGYVRAADGTAQDLACLDGVRLVLESGNYWAQGSIYRPERENGSKVVYENGGFVEYKKNGDIYYYGEANNSRSYGKINGSPVATWGLSFVSDRLGYGYRINYLSGYEAYFPEEIVYTVQRGGGAAGYAGVEFKYEADPYGNTTSVLGKKVNLGLRLASVESFSDNQTLRKYYLTYESNPSTRRSLLTRYAECDARNNCFQPTDFDWQLGPSPSFANGKYIKFPNQRSSPSVFEEGLHRAGFNRWVDINRDGFDDYCRVSPAAGGAEIVCYTQNGSTAFTLLTEIDNNFDRTYYEYDRDRPYDYPNWNIDPAWRDINNDGYVDFCVSRSLGEKLTAGTDTLQCWINNGEIDTEFNQTVTAEIPRPVRALSAGARSWTDVNGDGELDFCFAYTTDSEKDYISCSIKKKGLFEFEPGFTKRTVDFGGYWSDINGDGLPDFCVVEKQKITCDLNNSGVDLEGGRWVKAGSNFVRNEPDNFIYAGATTKYFSAVFVDFTGNGYSDFCRIYPHKQNNYHGYRASCLESTGEGWGNEVVSSFLPVVQAYQSSFGYESMAEATQFMDVNSDGLMDWCAEVDAELNCMISSAQGFGDEVVTYSLPSFGGYAGLRHIKEINRGWADINGDGNSSYCVLYWKSIGGPDAPPNNRGMACYDSGSSQKHDYLVGVENGFGLEYSVEYTDIADPTVYEHSRDLGSQGQVFATSGMNVVSKLGTSNGIGGYSEQEYFYKNYGYLPGEIGGLGFEYIKTTSENGNKVGEVWYGQSVYEHQAGRVVQSRTRLRVSSGQLVTVREENNEWETHFYSGLGYQDISATTVWDGVEATNYRYGVELLSSEVQDFDLTGQLIRTTTTENEYDATQLIEQSITTVGQNQTFNKVIHNSYYQDDYVGWVIGRLSDSQTSYSHSYGGMAASPITRESSWEYYQSGSPFYGMLKSETVEPNRPELSQTTTYTYNSYGLKASVVQTAANASPRSTDYLYDTRGQFMIRESNALGHQVSYDYDAVTGNLLSVTDPNGLVSSNEYDSVGRKTRETAPDGTSSIVEYKSCAFGCPAQAVYYTESWSESASGTKISSVSREYMDVLGRAVEVRTQGFSGDWIVQKTEYDSLGYEKRVSEPYYQSASPQWNVVSSRDVKGRVTQRNNASGLIVEITYNGLSTQTIRSWTDPLNGASESRTSSVLNDVSGNKRRSVDNGGRTVAFTYDALGNLVQIDLPGGMTVTNEYDVAGRRVASSDPNIGDWKYGYDAFGQLVLQENGAGRRVCLSYDVLGRKVSRTDDYSVSAPWASALASALNGCQGQIASTQWSYDDTSKGLGRLSGVTMGTGYSSEPFYDALGRPIQTETSFDGETYRKSTSYEAGTGRVSTITPTHRVSGPDIEVQYSYNARGFVTGLSEVGTQTSFWQVVSQNARGDVTERLLSGALINQVMGYDSAAGVMTQVRAKAALASGSGWNIQNESYVYAANGNMRQRAQAILAINQDLEETFSYDSLDRLVMADVANLNDANLSFSQTAQYDVAGNITERNDVGVYQYGEGCVHEQTSYQPGPQAVTSVQGQRNQQYCYDAAGNMVKGGGRDISYTAFNKPISITSDDAEIAFVYGPDQNMIKRTTDTNSGIVTKWMFADYERVESTASGAPSLRERWTLPGGVVVSVEDDDLESKKEEYLFSDTLGSVAAVTNGMGAVSERYRYDPWGRPRETLDWSAISDVAWFDMERDQGATGKGFTGHEMLDQVGIVHMGGRIYDPTIGRFLSADPVVKGLDNAESYNRYSYVLNSPMSYTDPSGYSWLSDTWDDITDFVKDHFKEVLAVFNPQLALMEASTRYGGRELARFAAKNKYAGEVIGLVGTVGCSLSSAGAATAGCVTAFQGWTSGAMAYGTGAPVQQALLAGTKSAALAYANIKVAGGIADMNLGAFGSGVAHGARGAFFAGIAGGDVRSGFLGGATEGVLGDSIQSWTDGDPMRGTVAAAFISGSVSQVTGGKFAVGAATGAMGYLFNQMSGRGCSGRPCKDRSNGPPPSLPQGVVDFATGFGSGLSFGLTDYINSSLGIGSYDVNSSLYKGANFLGAIHMAILSGGATVSSVAGTNALSISITGWSASSSFNSIRQGRSGAGYGLFTDAFGAVGSSVIRGVPGGAIPAGVVGVHSSMTSYFIQNKLE